MFKNLEFLALKSYELKQDQVDIWQFPLTDSLELADSVLNSEEKARARRFYFPRHQRRFATARTMMRVILAHYLNEQPAALLFDYNAYGKPTLHSNQGIQFNLSHSGDLALLAVGHTHPIGIDLEFFSERPYLGIAKDLFSTQEIEAFEALPETTKALGFFTIWSQKEAFIKACGMGLSYPTQEFSVPVLPPVNEPIFDKKHQKHWAMTSFTPTSGCSAALCCELGIRSIRKIDLTNEMMAVMLSASHLNSTT